MKDKLLIIGASGHGKVVADIALKMKKWKSIAFLDDDESIKSSIGLAVIGPSDKVLEYIDEYQVFIGIGNNATRQDIFEMLENVGANIPVIIHPNAVIGKQVEIGIGTVIMPGAIINCYTKIGKGCIINTGATLDHDNSIEDFVHISPGAHLAGNVKVGQGTWIGIGSVVSNNIRIKSDCIIGAGSVVIKDIPANCTAVGAPARAIKFREE